MSLSSAPFSHNHLTPLRASAETSFTPQPSLWQQVPLALTARPLSNQHLHGFIHLSSFPLFPLPSFPSSPFLSIVLYLVFGSATILSFMYISLPLCHFSGFYLLFQNEFNSSSICSLIHFSIPIPPGDGTVILSWFKYIHVTPVCFHYLLWYPV